MSKHWMGWMLAGALAAPAFAESRLSAAARPPEPTEEAAPAVPVADTSARRGSFVLVTSPPAPAVPSRPVHVPLDDAESTAVVVRPGVVAPAATVGRALADQPVHPYLIEVRVNHTTVYLDPDTDYQHRRVGTLDENQYLQRAQRLYQGLNAQGARVIYGPAARRPAAGTAVPAEMGVILLKPDLLRRPATPGGSPAVPSVPAAPDPRQVTPKVVLAQVEAEVHHMP